MAAQAPLDVLVLGKSGSGKSNLINAMKAWPSHEAPSSEAQGLPVKNTFIDFPSYDPQSKAHAQSVPVVVQPPKGFSNTECGLFGGKVTLKIWDSPAIERIDFPNNPDTFVSNLETCISRSSQKAKFDVVLVITPVFHGTADLAAQIVREIVKKKLAEPGNVILVGSQLERATDSEKDVFMVGEQSARSQFFEAIKECLANTDGHCCMVRTENWDELMEAMRQLQPIVELLGAEVSAASAEFKVNEDSLPSTCSGTQVAVPFEGMDSGTDSLGFGDSHSNFDTRVNEHSLPSTCPAWPQVSVRNTFLDTREKVSDGSLDIPSFDEKAQSEPVVLSTSQVAQPRDLNPVSLIPVPEGGEGGEEAVDQEEDGLEDGVNEGDGEVPMASANETQAYGWPPEWPPMPWSPYGIMPPPFWPLPPMVTPFPMAPPVQHPPGTGYVGEDLQDGQAEIQLEMQKLKNGMAHDLLKVRELELQLVQHGKLKEAYHFKGMDTVFGSTGFLEPWNVTPQVPLGSPPMQTIPTDPAVVPTLDTEPATVERPSGAPGDGEGRSLDEITKPEATLQIYVQKALTGQTIPLMVMASDCVNSVKKKITDSEGTPPDEQRLLFDEKELEGTRSLSDYGIDAASTLQLVHIEAPPGLEAPRVIVKNTFVEVEDNFLDLPSFDHKAQTCPVQLPSTLQPTPEASQVFRWQILAAPFYDNSRYKDSPSFRIINTRTRQSVLCAVTITAKPSGTKKGQQGFKQADGKGFIALNLMEAQPPESFRVEITFEVGKERRRPKSHDFSNKENGKTCKEQEEWDFKKEVAQKCVTIKVMVDENHRVEKEQNEDDEEDEKDEG